MIKLFAKNATTFLRNGICVLNPTVCTVSEIAGGSYELHMEHPMDKDGKFLLIKEDMIIRAPVPRRVIPSVTLPEVTIWTTTAQADVYSVLPVWKANELDPAVQAVKLRPGDYEWKVGKGYNAGALVVYYGKIYKAQMFNFAVIPTSTSAVWAYVMDLNSGSSGGSYTTGTIIETVAANTIIYKIADYNAMYIQIRTQNGNVGYIERAKCTSTTSTQAGEVVPSRTVTEQSFRIYKVECDNQKVIVNAKHLSYDFNGNSLFECKLYGVDPQTAIAIMHGSLINPDDRKVVCNITESKITEDWSFLKPINVLLDPSSGLIKNLNAALIRDDADFFLLDNSSPRQEITIAYGANMLGVKWTRNIEGVVTRVLPRANNGTSGYVYISGLFVDSAAINDYAYPRTEVLDCHYSVGEEYEKADGTKITWTEDSIRTQMAEDAANRFSKDHADIPEIMLEVQFLLLGDTVEYRQYKGLQSLLLYDEIKVVTGPSGVTATAQVTEYEYNCLTGVYNSIRVGNVSNFRQRVPGYTVVAKSITYDKLSEDVINRIRTANASGSTDSYSPGGSETGGAVTITTDVIDALDSARTDAALSANQGRVLNDKIDNRIKSAAISKTTDRNGAFTVYSNNTYPNRKILSIVLDGYACRVWQYTQNNICVATVISYADGSRVANTAVTGWYTYIDE